MPNFLDEELQEWSEKIVENKKEVKKNGQRENFIEFCSKHFS